MNCKLKLLKSAFLFCMAGLSAYPLAAFEKFTDEKGEYVVGSDGGKHYLLFQNAWDKDKTCWGGTYGYDRSKAATRENKGGWVNNTVWTFEKDAVYGGSLHFGRKCTVHGILFETAAFSSHNIYFEGMPLHIGEFGIRSEVGGLKMAIYNGSGAKNLNLTASQTWSGPASDVLTSDGFLIVVNQPYEASYTNNLYAADDVVLTIEGNTFVNMLAYGNEMTNAEVVVKSPAVLSLPHYSYGTGRLNARKLTLDGGAGMRFGKDKSVVFSQAPDSDGYGIGSVPLISPLQVAETIVLVNGAALKAVQTSVITGGVTIVSSGAVTNSFSGTFDIADDETVIRVEEGSTLDISDAVFTGSGRVSFEGAGDALLTVGTDGDYCYLPDFDFSKFSGALTVNVTSGTLVLESVSSIPAGSRILTEGEGGVLVIDDTGFNADTMLGGTGNKIAPSRLLVTDTDVTGEVSVAKGETLVVFGDGLGANASLKLWGGATVMFRGRDAEISSPVWSTNTVYFKTFDSSATGRVSGVYDTAGTSNMRFTSPGLIEFSGSGRWRHFYMDSGRVDVTGRYDVYGTQYFYGGHMLVRDGGHIKIKEGWQYLRLQANSEAGACLEISDDGVFEKVAGNVYEYIGDGNASRESKLLLTGGTFIHKYDEFNLYAGGVIEIDSGTLQTGRRITCRESATKDNAKVIVRNGRWLITAGSAGYAKGMFDGGGECTVHIDGHGTLQYTGQKDMPDSTSEKRHAVWTCSEGARLKVLGYDFKDSTVTLRNFEADGLAFDFNERAYASRPVSVLLADQTNQFKIGFVLPGKEGSKVVSTNAVAPRLIVDYTVPDGATFDVSQLPSGWYEGFDMPAVSNLLFESGSALRFPFPASPYSPLNIAGTLTLPEAMDYSVAAVVRAAVENAEVIVPAMGVVQQGESECDFTCIGGVRAEFAALAATESALVFSYDPPGTVIVVR